MPKDKPINTDAEGLRPLPKPIKLNLPSERPKPQRRLHEPDSPEYIMPEDMQYDFAPEPESPKKRKDKQEQKRPTGKRYFDTVQKAYGQRRPRQPKPLPKQKPLPRQRDAEAPRLGKGDRLYTPPRIKKPLVSPRVKRVLSFWSLGVVAVIFIVLALMSMFRHNAWAVYVDDRFVGYMPINREVETYTVHNDAVRHLSDSHRTAVQVNEATVVRTARARGNEIISPSEMTLALIQHFTYQIVASAIYLDGERIAILRNSYETDHVENEIQRVFFYGSERNIVASFEEDWEIRLVTVNLEDLDSQDAVIQLLNRPVSYIHSHTIRDGDTQGHLALEFSTTLESIGYLNNIGLDAILVPGQTLYLEFVRPRLSVRTVGEITVLEDIPMEIIKHENPDWHVSVTYVRQEGRNGQREVVQLITRINGIITGEPEIISERVITAPEDRVEEVGTSTAAIEVR